MKTLPLLAILIPGIALAQPAPTTLELPADFVGSVRVYLGTRPYDEVANAIAIIEACKAVQIPQDGKIMDRGQCPAVSATIKARQPKTEVAPEAPQATQPIMGR